MSADGGIMDGGLVCRVVIIVYCLAFFIFTCFYNNEGLNLCRLCPSVCSLLDSYQLVNIDKHGQKCEDT